MSANGDEETSERIRIAAEAATEAAEEHAAEEILGLERDVERARAEIESLRKSLADVEERAEQAAARATEAEQAQAAAERFGAELRSREQEVEQERIAKAELIERTDRRLREIQLQSRDAAERVAAAERQLAEEAEHLRADAEARVRRQAEEAARETQSRLEQARATAEAEAEERVGELEAKVKELQAQRASTGAEAERRVQEAEERAWQAEQAAARAPEEARVAAAEWLRSQTKALRRDAEREARRESRESARRAERERELRLREVEGRVDREEVRRRDRLHDFVTRFRGLRIDPGRIAAWLLPALLIVFLSLENGGYDVIARSEAGIVSWWLILVGTVVGIVSIAWHKPASATVGLLAGFGVWTALSLAWTESAERTTIEVARIATYLGVFVLGLAIQARRYGRQMLNGITTSVGIVIAIATLSRLEPNWFPAQDPIGELLPEAALELQSRLAYPLDYSTGLAVLAAMAVPLMLAAATSGRTAIGRYLAPPMLPIAALTLWLTGSSLALPSASVTVLAYLVATDERLRALALLALSAAGGAILVLAAESRDALDRGLTTPEAMGQGDEMLVIALIVCAGVVAGQALLVRAFERWPRLGLPRLTPHSARRTAMIGTAMIAIGAAIVIALAAGGAGQLSERWEDFQSAEGVDPERESRGTQLLDVSARGRYQYWQSAIDAYETEPLVGLGPGTFEFWWAREGDPEAAIFVRDAHSLYLEVLAELGLVGFLLLVAFMVVVLVQGALRSYRSPPAERAPLAAAVAASFAFAVAAAVEWIWELGALPAIFLLLAAIVVGEVDTPEAGVKDRPTRRPWSRVAGIALPVAFSVIALIAMAIPFAAASFVDASREAAVEGRLDDALSEARHAVAIEPFAATPRMQEAAVLERLGQTSKAVEAARAATEKEPTNWRTWVVLSRLEALNGNPEGSAEAFERARSLFPRLIGT